MSDLSDEELMNAYAAGDEAAFAEIYARYSGKVYAFLRKNLKSREEVDEVFQKAFLKFHNARKNYNPSYPLMQWLYVVARTTLLDHLRSLNRQIKVDQAPVNLDPRELSQGLGQQALCEEREIAMLEGLSVDQRQIVEMKFLDDLTYEEIAQKLNKSQDSIRQAVSRAFKKIRGTA